MYQPPSHSPIKPVALYIRVSTDGQVKDGNGLDVQKEQLSEYVKYHKLTTEEQFIYIDDGKSGATTDRPEFQRMMQDASRGLFDRVLVTKMDRFSRNTTDLLVNVDLLTEYDVGFVATTQPYLDTTGTFGKVILAIFGSMAEMERDQIRERTMAGKRKCMMDGKWVNGRPPYGYKKAKDGFLRVREDEAKVVRLIYELYTTKDMSINQVAEEITKMGIPTSTKKGNHGDFLAGNTKSLAWSGRQVQKMLRDSVYKGQMVQGRYRYEKIGGVKRKRTVDKKDWIVGKCPVIVKKKVWDEAQYRADFNKENATRNSRTTYLLSGRLRCGLSGYMMTGYRSSKQTKNYRPCVNKSKLTQGQTIKYRSIACRKIDDVVWDKMTYLLKNSDLLEKEVTKYFKQENNRERVTKRKIECLEQEIIKVQGNNDILLGSFNKEDGMMDVIKERVQVNVVKLEKLKKEIQALKGELDTKSERNKKVRQISTFMKKIGDNLDSLSVETKRKIYLLLLKEVVIYEEEIELILKAPKGNINVWEYEETERRLRSPRHETGEPEIKVKVGV